jgi:hypothetical protein
LADEGRLVNVISLASPEQSVEAKLVILLNTAPWLMLHKHKKKKGKWVSIIIVIKAISKLKI